jgi:lipopolysaccharide export system protein LptA
VIAAGRPGFTATSRRRTAALVLLAAAVTVAGSSAWSQRAKHDSKLPIEITADSLEVLQNDEIATFVGNVDAVQGDLVLSSDQLRVHYRAGEEENGATAGTIRRIEATGNVFLSSPTETAQGEFGVYDVDGALLTLEGSVVLTRDDNVVRGERLEIDLATGRSQVFAAVPSTAGGTPSQRVKAVFVPPPKSVEPAAGPASPSGDAAAARPEPSPPKAIE